MSFVFKSNQRTILFIGTCFFFGALGLALTEFTEFITVGMITQNICWSIAFILSIMLLIKESGFAKTVYWRISMIMLSLLVVGSLFRLQHWPWANTLLTIGFIGIAIVYFFRFLKKKHQNRLDFLKLLWVISICANGISVVWRITKELKFLSLILLVLCLLEFVANKKRSAY